MPRLTRVVSVAAVIALRSFAAYAQQECTLPDPAQRPAPAQQYFMVIVDTSGSMTEAVGSANSCGYPNDRFGHARCAVRRLLENFNDRADFGLAQFPTRATGVTNPCFGSPSVGCYQSEMNTTGQCTGCGPVVAGVRRGARVLVPITTDDALLRSYVDNSCLNPEVGPPVGNTPLNGSLREMKRYLQSGFTDLDSGALLFPSPLASNTLACRRVNVILLTDGDETCDTQAAAVSAAADLFNNGVTVAGRNYKVRTYVVNFAGGSIANTDQIAAAGGTGSSLFATSEAQLNQAFTTIMTRPPEIDNGLDDDCNGCVDDGIARLTLQKSVAPATVRRGDAFAYTVTATNSGPTIADATMTDPLPSSVLFTSLTAPADWTCTTPAPDTGGTITCRNALFGVGATATFTINVRASNSAPIGNIVNNAGLAAAFGASAPKSGSATTTVVSNQPPVANAGPNQSYAAGSACAVDVTLDGNASTDPDGDALTYVWSRPGFASLSGVTQNVTLGPGTHTFTLTVNDGHGGSASVQVDIIVTDTNRPTIAAPPDVTQGSDPNVCGGTVASLGMVTAADNCGGPVVTRVPAGNFFPVGTTEVIWTATDAAGLTATATQRVTIKDTNAPSITAPPAVHRAIAPDATSCATVISDADLGTATASDSCPGAVTVTRSGVPAGNLFRLGTTTITYTARDGAGNTSTATQTITVVDTTPPKITAPPTIHRTTGPGEAACGLVIPDEALGSGVANEICAGVAVSRSGVPSGNFFPVGTTTITYTAVDASGNTSTATQVVTVTDGTAPSITAPPALNLVTPPNAIGCALLVADATLGTASANDNCPGVVVTRSGVPAGNLFPVGVTTVTYAARDAAGNVTTATQTVTVRDATPPAISAPAAVNLPADAAGCSLVIADELLGVAGAADNCAGVTVTRSGVPAGNLFPVGTTTITYTARDAAGNTSTATQSVTVADTTKPTITAPPAASFGTGPGANACAVLVSDAMLGSASANDNCPGIIVTRSGVPAGNLFPLGTTTISYTATDPSGNSATATQTITVRDTTPPALTLAGSATITLSCRAAFNDPGANAIDNCNGDLSAVITRTGSVNASVPGTYGLTYSVTDSAGNTSTAQRTVVVLDDAPPVINSATVTPNVLWPANHKMVPVTVSVSATDVCSGSATCSIASISSNEPIEGLGDGDTAPDWRITGALTAELRAERGGKGAGRVYTITIRCVDGGGGFVERTVTVTVPHSK